MEGIILDRFTVYIDGREQEVVFRFPGNDDAVSAMNYINELADEKAFLANLDKVTLEQETEWLESLLEQCREKKSIHVVVEHDGIYSGACEARIGDGETAHAANVGISLKRQLRGRGVGKRLMHFVMDLARHDYAIELFWLQTFSDNKPAISLYENLGFEIAGTIPAYHKRDGEYFDITYIYKQV